MKKLLALLLVFLMLTVTVVGCSKNQDGNESKEPVSSDEVVDDDTADLDEDEPEDEPEEEEDEDYEDDYDYDYDFDEDYEEEEEEEIPLTPEEQRLESMLLGQDKELNNDAIYSEGNLARIAKAVNKSKRGEEVTLVFYGNSANTSGNGEVTSAETLYSKLVGEWWEANIGPCKVVTTGLDNLTSTTACMRVDFDVLQFKPDVVFLDFSVQDAINGQSNSNAIGFDNLVRRILYSKTNPGVVTLLLTGAEQASYLLNPKNANMYVSAAKHHKLVSKHYNLPILDFESSVWENFTELVKVTTKTEIPLISWQTISFNNVAMTDDGHAILAGVIQNFISERVVKKLSKISTKDPKFPAEGYFGIDKYMKGEFTDIDKFVYGQDGYSCDLSKDKLETYGYYYKGRSELSPKSHMPNITTYRHYIPEDPNDPKDVDKEENPYYLTLSMPKVTNAETFFLIHVTNTVKGSASIKFSPLQLISYDAEGNVIDTNKPVCTAFNETKTSGRILAVRVPVNATKVEFRAYTPGGAIRILGIGEYK